MTLASSQFRLPRFYPIVDTALLKDAPLGAVELAGMLVEGGVRILQYRHKGAWTQSHFDEAKQIARRCDDTGVLFVMNDRADYAKLLRSALHLGQEDLPVRAARALIGDEVVGLSTHNRNQLESGDEQEVEYLSIGPIFATASKENPDPVVGLEGLKKLRRMTAKPLCAIGGITLENAREVVDAGADSLAVISALLPGQPDEGWGKADIRRRIEMWLQIG